MYKTSLIYLYLFLCMSALSWLLPCHILLQHFPICFPLPFYIFLYLIYLPCISLSLGPQRSIPNHLTISAATAVPVSLNTLNTSLTLTPSSAIKLASVNLWHTFLLYFYLTSFLSILSLTSTLLTFLPFLLSCHYLPVDQFMLNKLVAKKNSTMYLSFSFIPSISHYFYLTKCPLYLGLLPSICL